MTDEQHNKYIAWAFLAHGAFQTLLMSFMVAIFSLVFFAEPSRGNPPPFPVFFIVLFAFLVQMVFTLPSFIAAFGLFKKKRWARMTAIVAGVISAMNVPIGTATCVYTFWFFMGENWKSVYQPEFAFKPCEPKTISRSDESRWTGYYTDEKGEVRYKAVDPPDWR